MPTPHPRIEQPRAGLPAGTGAVIDKALEKDPNKRYQRDSEMAADLRAVLAKAAAGA